MNNFLQKLLRLKTPVKAAATLAIMVLIAAAYGGLFYLDIQDQIKGAKARSAQLQTEKSTYEKRKREYQAYRTELTQLQQEQRDLLKALPRKAEIPTFLSNLQEQAELAGLEIISLAIDAENPMELYIRIPVRIEVRGTYHSITKFFKNLSELPRIVNVEKLALSVEKGEAGVSPRMRARFVAVTFRYRGGAGGGRHMRRLLLAGIAAALVATAWTASAQAADKAKGAAAKSAGAKPSTPASAPGKAAAPPPVAASGPDALAQRLAVLRRKVLREEDFAENDDTNRDPFRSYLDTWIERPTRMISPTMSAIFAEVLPGGADAHRGHQR